MLRSFCIGALAGFFFGSSKTGTQMRARVDGFFSDMLDSAESELKLAESDDDLSEEKNSNSRGNGRKLNEVGLGKGRQGRGAEHKAEAMEQPKSKNSRSNKVQKAQQAEPAQPKQKENATAAGEGTLPMKKAVELAEKLNAKPTTPPDEEQAPS